MGARLGILMLETRFPRIVGDVGNAESFDFDVAYRVVAGATPETIVTGDGRVWVEAFIKAGRALVADGCTGLATSCGFLTLVRDEVASACGVPVASSALEQVGLVQAMLPKGQRVGVLTISEASLSAAHLAAAGAPADVLLRGLDGSAFARAILGNALELDAELAEREMVGAAKAFVADHPEIGALVLECTNMPPYAAAVRRATGRPVVTILDYLRWFQSGLPEVR